MNMKRNILTCAICVMLYVVQLPISGLFVALVVNPDLSETAISAAMLACLAASAVVLVLCILALVSAIKGGIKSFSPLKTTFWVKIALIPFFIINFIIWALFWLATINPFLILFGPFIWVISLFATYVFMIGGGLQNIVYLVKRYLAERQFRYLLYAVLHFIYIADIVAAGLACYDEKKAKNQCPDAV